VVLLVTYPILSLMASLNIILIFLAITIESPEWSRGTIHPSGLSTARCTLRLSKELCMDETRVRVAVRALPFLDPFFVFGFVDVVPLHFFLSYIIN
jgi:hypothetical protein